jgi:hypothetical protein
MDIRAREGHRCGHGRTLLPLHGVSGARLWPDKPRSVTGGSGLPSVAATQPHRVVGSSRSAAPAGHTGSRRSWNTSVTGVTLAGIAASYTVDSAMQITATVPSVCRAGTGVGGDECGRDALVSPGVHDRHGSAAGDLGDEPDAWAGRQLGGVDGYEFHRCDRVTLAGIAASYTVDSAMQITAAVPSIGASAGRWRVTTAGGTGLYDPVFTIMTGLQPSGSCANTCTIP